MTFLIRPGYPERTTTIIAERVRVTFREVQKEVRNLGWAREVAFDRWNKRKLNIRPLDGVRSNGRPAHTDVAYIDGLTGPKVRERLRVLATDDIREIARIDDDIADLVDKIAALRAKRHELVIAAWRRGGTPNISDLIEQAKAYADEREARSPV